MLINIPKIAKYEWHPFTISSSPELTETMWLHVRNVGTWTGKLYNYYQKATRPEGSFRRRTKSMRDLIFDERYRMIKNIYIVLELRSGLYVFGESD